MLIISFESLKRQSKIHYLKNGYKFHFRPLNEICAIDLYYQCFLVSRCLCDTFVYYPTLGCDIQGFQAMGLSVQNWPQWFQNFPAIWMAVPFGANAAHLGICTLPEKNLLCVWNELFLDEIKFCQSRTRPVKSLWWQVVPMQESRNAWKNLAFFLNNGTCGNTMVKNSNSKVPIDEILYRNFGNVPELKKYRSIQS